MTTIAYRNGILAADSMATRGGSIMPERSQKVFRLRDGRLFGWCGEAGLGVRARMHFDDPKKHDPVVTTDGGALVIGLDGSIWTYEHGALVAAPGAPFYALGSGRGEAYGALAMGATARQAVAIAARFDNCTGGPVQWLRLRSRS